MGIRYSERSEGGLAAWIDLTEASLRRKTGTIITRTWQRAQLDECHIKRTQTPTSGKAESRRSKADEVHSQFMF